MYWLRVENVTISRKENSKVMYIPWLMKLKKLTGNILHKNKYLANLPSKFMIASL